MIDLLNNYYVVSFGYYTSITFWVVSIIIYLLKIIHQDFGQVTSYGKLKDFKNKKDSNNTKIKSNENDIIISLLKLFQLDSEIINTKKAWMLFYLTLVILSNIFFFLLSEYENKNIAISQILFTLFSIQGGRRLFETEFIQKHRETKMNGLLFISGLSYYLFLTVSIYTETIVNIDKLQPLNKLNLIIALIFFIIGSFEQFKSHEILASIRSTNSINIGIPKGRLFNYVSSPHYFSELLIYSSFLILSNFNFFSLWLNFIFTSLNLIHRSTETNKWYNTKFTNYPKSRKSIIPFVL